ncbi:MAG: tetratricopeptide repeat protein [bacterium]
MVKYRNSKFILIFILLIVIFLCCKIPEKERPKALNKFSMKCADYEVYKEAEYRLKQAIDIEPHNPNLHNNLAIVLEAQGKIKDAYREYKHALSLDPDNEVILRNLEEFKRIHKNDIEE